MTESLTVLVIGSGPIIIGQAAEFDYSGTQCCAALREAGHRVVLVNSNPATIQTDPETADAVYIEPLTIASLTRIIEREKPDAIMPGMGGQTALNLTVALAKAGVLTRHAIRVLGSSLEAIAVAEDRALFRQRMEELGEPVPRSGVATSLSQALALGDELGYPAIVRPAFTLGGTGGGIADTRTALEIVAGRGLALSPTTQVLIEASVLGWQEFEFEVLRDVGDEAVIVCAMENLDPMGVHTGESIVVAPTLTLPDRDYQRLRTAALRIVRGLDIVGGCNVQFAYNPADGSYVVIEVNPRVSRSSALASKATGVPIARVATLLALGHRLHALPNYVTGTTSAAFEPALDYVVLKIPRWPFDKFPLADRSLGTQMKSTGETMALGRSFEAALLKAWRSLGQGAGFPTPLAADDATLTRLLRQPTDQRLAAVWEALARKWSVGLVAELCGYHRFFVARIAGLVTLADRIRRKLVSGQAGVSQSDENPALDPELLREAKRAGFGDAHLAALSGLAEDEIRRQRQSRGLTAGFAMVDTCAGEFAAATPYFYSAYGEPGDAIARGRSVLILGSGPIRIGQGIEFDYSTVHGVQAVREAGYEAVVVNNNPETVSTDFDASDRLYFEPLVAEEVLALIDAERPWGIILQLGGQTAVNLADDIAAHLRLHRLPTRVLGTPLEAMALAEDRRRCGERMAELGVAMPTWKAASSAAEVMAAVERLGYPVLVRPSFVLGGRAMEIIHSRDQLSEYLVREAHATPQRPVLVDRFLEGARELDVDLVCDGRRVCMAVMEQIEMAGVHSGDSACALPTQTLDAAQREAVVALARRVALGLGIIGAANLQLALTADSLYLLEVNPRASRTFPFVAKATGVPLARLAVQAMLGGALPPLPELLPMEGAAVKVPTFPWLKLPGVDTVLTPEMKSTGEAMGRGATFGAAYRRAMDGAGKPLPSGGTVYLSVDDRHKPGFMPVAQELSRLDFRLIATRGTAATLREASVAVETVWRISEQRQPDALGLMRQGDVTLVINLPAGPTAARDAAQMRRLAVELGIPFITTLAGTQAATEALGSPETGAVAPLNPSSVAALSSPSN